MNPDLVIKELQDLVTEAANHRLQLAILRIQQPAPTGNTPTNIPDDPDNK